MGYWLDVSAFLQVNRFSVKNAENHTLACIGLQKYLRLTDNPSYFPAGYVDSQSESGQSKLGDWRNLVTETNGTLKYVRNVQGCRNKGDVVEMRDGIMSYVNGEGEAEWQVAHVRYT